MNSPAPKWRPHYRSTLKMPQSEKKGFAGDFTLTSEATFDGFSFIGIEATRNYLVCFEGYKSEFWILSFELEKIETFRIEGIIFSSTRIVMKYNEMTDTLLVFYNGKLFNIDLQSKTIVWSNTIMNQAKYYGCSCVGLTIDSRGIIYLCTSRYPPAMLYVIAHNGEVVGKAGKECSQHRLEMEIVMGMSMDGEENMVITTFDKNEWAIVKVSRMLKEISRKVIQHHFKGGSIIYDSAKNHFIIPYYNGIAIHDMKFNQLSQQMANISQYDLTLSNHGILYLICGENFYNSIKAYQ